MRNILLFYLLSIIGFSCSNRENLSTLNQLSDDVYRWSIDSFLSEHDVIVYDASNNKSLPFSETQNVNGSACIVIPHSICPSCFVYQFESIIELAHNKGIELIVLCDNNNLRDMLNSFPGCKVISNEIGFTIKNDIIPTGPILYKYQNGTFICGFVIKVNHNEPIESFFNQCFIR